MCENNFLFLKYFNVLLFLFIYILKERGLFGFKMKYINEVFIF